MICFRKVALLAMAAIASAQPRLQFEVASVKPVVTPSNMVYAMDSSRVDLDFISLRNLIMLAYKLEAWEVAGPDWMRTSRFEVRARLPQGATKEQVPEMMQSLLADRFKLVSHRETKEESVYALQVGKDGPNLKEGAADNRHSDSSWLNGRSILAKYDADDGYWSVSQKRGSAEPRIFDAARITMSELARPLLFYVDGPVVDMTGLNGVYQVSLEVPLDLKAAANALARRPAMDGASDPSGDVSIFAAIRKLGLTLTKRKAPVDHLVVDQVEMVPTEN